MHGKGTLNMAAMNLVYKGYFNQDRIEGKGCITTQNHFSNASYVEGQFLNGKLQSGDCEIFFTGLTRAKSLKGKLTGFDFTKLSKLYSKVSDFLQDVDSFEGEFHDTDRKFSKVFKY